MNETKTRIRFDHFTSLEIRGIYVPVLLAGLLIGMLAHAGLKDVAEAIRYHADAQCLEVVP